MGATPGPLMGLRGVLDAERVRLTDADSNLLTITEVVLMLRSIRAGLACVRLTPLCLTSTIIKSPGMYQAHPDR